MQDIELSLGLTFIQSIAGVKLGVYFGNLHFEDFTKSKELFNIMLLLLLL
jgi:hypothetical protein